MAILSGKVKVAFRRQEIVLESGVRIESYVDITDYVNGVKMEKLTRYAIRKVHAPLLNIKQVNASILETNPYFSRKVWDDNMFYAYVVDCINKPAPIGNIEWIELGEL